MKKGVRGFVFLGIILISMMVVSAETPKVFDLDFAKCGSADGKLSMDMPTANLCERGTANEVLTNLDKQYWVWSCNAEVLGTLYASPCSSYKKIVETFWITGQTNDDCNENVGTNIQPNKFSSTNEDCHFGDFKGWSRLKDESITFSQGPILNGYNGCFVYAREEDHSSLFLITLKEDKCNVGVVDAGFIFDGTAGTSKVNFYKKFSMTSNYDNGILMGKDDNRYAACLLEKWGWGFSSGYVGQNIIESSYICNNDGYWYTCDADTLGKEMKFNGKTFKCEKIKRMFRDMNDKDKDKIFDFYIWQQPEDCKGTGDGSSSNPYKITCCTELQNMDNHLDAYYELTNNIDCSVSKTWSIPPGIGKGFKPIGNFYTPFTGSFDGKGYKINNLFIDTDRQDVGLFGAVNGGSSLADYEKKIKNVELTNVNIKGSDYVGCLAGKNNGKEIYNISCTGSVNGNDYVGGLVGDNQGVIETSYFNGNVIGKDQVGGLVGRGYDQRDINIVGIISSSYSKGTVTGDNKVGGLAGSNYGTIWSGYSTSNVKGTDKSLTGGLVGINYRIIKNPTEVAKGKIENSFFAGSVTNGYGLVGQNKISSDSSDKISRIVNDYWYSQITGGSGLSVMKDPICIGNKDQSGCYLINKFAQNKFDSITTSCVYLIMYLVPSSNYYILQYKNPKCLTAGNIGLDYFKGAVKTIKNNEPFDKWDFTNTWAEIAIDSGSLVNDFPMLKWQVSCGLANGQKDIADETELKSKGLCPNSLLSTPTNYASNGLWTWRCAKDGIYYSSLCSAWIRGATIKSECDSTTITQTFETADKITQPCVSGNIPSAISLDTTTNPNKWKWTCTGTDPAVSCEANKGTPTKSTPQCEAAGGSCQPDCGTGTYLGQLDCPATQTCCKTTPETCENGQEKCVGTDSYLCENKAWVNKGTDIVKCPAPTPDPTKQCGDYETPGDCVKDTDNKKDLGYLTDSVKTNIPPVANDKKCTYQLIDLCRWEDNQCVLTNYNKDSPKEILSELNDCEGPCLNCDGCSYETQKTGNCNAGDNFIQVSYIPLSGCTKTKDPINVACSAKLPFFTWLNILLVIGALVVFYVIFNVVGKKKGKKRR